MADHPEYGTVIAMVATGADRFKFNEAVSRSWYSPRTPGIPGKYRMFDRLDLFGLRVMADLLKLGFPLPLAAQRAQGARDTIELYPDAQTIWIHADYVWPDGPPEGASRATNVVIDVPTLRKELDDKLARVTGR